MQGESSSISSRRFAERSRLFVKKLDGICRTVRDPARFAIDFGRFETAAGTVSLSEELVPGHFPSLHCGTIRGKSFLILPIRSQSRSDDSNRSETAHAFPVSLFHACRANRAQSDRGDLLDSCYPTCELALKVSPKFTDCFDLDRMALSAAIPS